MAEYCSAVYTRQRAALFDLPTTESEFLTHYILSDADLSEINIRRGPHNQIGFAVQLCALRHPGRLLQRGEIIPAAMLDFTAGALHMACFVGFLALKSGVTTVEDVLGDFGLIHEIAHNMDIGEGDPCVATRSEVVRMARKIEQAIPGHPYAR